MISFRFGKATATLLLSAATMLATVHSTHVFIHHMVGLTHSYDKADWERDMIEAKNAGIEAFALNMGPGSWERDRVRDAYLVAETFPTVFGFKLFISYDMDHFEHGYTAAGLGPAMKDYVDEFAASSANFVYNGGAIVSTFSGGSTDFGLADTNAGWQWLKDNTVPTIYLLPSFFIHPTSISNFPAVDGLFKWKAWQYDGKGDRNQVGRTDADWQAALQANGQTFMASVSPCFFTHYPVSGWNKNWYFGGDDHLLVTRWEEMMSLVSTPEFVELVTYNDFGESHYMTSPDNRPAPSGTDWVVGFDHTAWLRLSSIYAHAYQNSGNVASVSQDQLFYYYRPHPKAAVATGDTEGPPWHCIEAEDSIYAVAVMKSAAMVHIENAGTTVSTAVGAGITLLEVPFVAGSVSVSVERSSVTILSATGMDIEASPVKYNFNYFVDDVAEALDTARQGGSVPCYTLWSDVALCCSSKDSRPAFLNQDCVHVNGGGGCQPSGFVADADWAKVVDNCRATIVEPEPGYPCASITSKDECCKRKDSNLSNCVYGNTAFASGAMCESYENIDAAGEISNIDATCPIDSTTPATTNPPLTQAEALDPARQGGSVPCYTLWLDVALCCSSKDSRSAFLNHDCVHVNGGGGCQPSGFVADADWAKVVDNCRATIVEPEPGYPCASITSKDECCKRKDSNLSNCFYGNVAFGSGNMCESAAYITANGETANIDITYDT